MRLLSYNMAKRPAAWAEVFATGADVAMLQEIANPDGIEHTIRLEGEPWQNQVMHHEHVWRNACIHRRILTPRFRSILTPCTGAC